MEGNVHTNYRDSFKNPVLTREEQFELVDLYKNTGDISYRDRLLLCNIRFIYNIAKGFQRKNSGTTIDDLMTVGCLGFLHAIEKFDKSHNVTLITYAKNWVKAFIRSEFYENSTVIRIPTSSLIKRNKILKLINKKGDDISNSEISKELEISTKTVRNLRNAGSSVSIDQELAYGEGEQFTLLNVIEDEDRFHKKFVDEGAFEYILSKIDGLDERSIYILGRRFGLDGHEPMTLEEISDRLNISRERVRQIQRKAIQDIRKMIASDDNKSSAIIGLLKKIKKI